MIQVLFPLGVRLTTILTALAFVGLAVARRERRPLVAGWLWLTTFEAVFQIASLVMGKLPLGLFSPIFFLVLAALTLLVTRGKVTPDWRYLAAALVFVAIWMATGFHLNGHQHGMFSLHTRIPDFNVPAEIFNDVAKTLWALAYIVPLFRRSGEVGPRGRRTGPRSRFGSAAAANAVASHTHVREEQHDEDSGEDDVQDHRAS